MATYVTSKAVEDVIIECLIIPVIGLFIPLLAVIVRRLHDTGRSGMNIFWFLVPLFGPVALFIFFVQGSKTSNQDGENHLSKIS